MKVLAINGSPRKNGNTALLLSTALEPLKQAGWETELVQLGGKKFTAAGAVENVRNSKMAAAFLTTTYSTSFCKKCWLRMP